MASLREENIISVPFVADCSDSVKYGWYSEEPSEYCTIHTGSPGFSSSVSFQANKSSFFSPFLCWSGGPPIHQQWEPQGRRNQHLGNILYLVVARLSYPMCQDVCQVLLVRWHISFVVNRPIILPGRPETRIQVTYYIPDLSLFLTMCMILSV